MAEHTTPLMGTADLARFEAKHTKGDGCWIWHASGSNGYGSLAIAGYHHPAHRLSYVYHVGPIPAGLFVLHACDVRACVRPSHLRVGTAKDNADDRTDRGRWRGPERKKRGRPPKPGAKQKALVIRCQAPTLERWHAAGAARGVSVSAQARLLLEAWADDVLSGDCQET